MDTTPNRTYAKYPDLKKVYKASKHAAGITHTIKQMGYEKE